MYWGFWIGGNCDCTFFMFLLYLSNVCQARARDNSRGKTGIPLFIKIKPLKAAFVLSVLKYH